MRLSLKKWAESEFKTDSQLNLIPTLFVKLRCEGHDFTDTSGTPAKSAAPLSKDPNVVSSQKEQDDIALAIELSLKEKGGRSASPKQASSTAINTPYVSFGFYPPLMRFTYQISPSPVGHLPIDERFRFVGASRRQAGGSAQSARAVRL